MKKDHADRKLIIIKSVPYQVNKTVLIEKIALLIRDKKLEGIADLRDESNKEGVRIVIELKKGFNQEIIINQLYKFSPLENSFGFNTLAINEKKPELLNLKQFIEIFVNFREKTIIKRTLFDLKKAKDRSHILIGLFIAVENIDEIISIIRKSKTPNDAKISLLKKTWNFKKSKLDKNILNINELIDLAHYQLSDFQVKAILDLRLQKLTAIGYDEINNELSELYELIIKLKRILNDKTELINLIKNELIGIKNKFSTPRKTKIIDQITSVEVEDVIQKEQVIVTVTNKGYIKRTPITNIKAQKRGGRGKIGIITRRRRFCNTIILGEYFDTCIIFFK